MKTRSLAIDAKDSVQRRLAASLLTLSVAAALALWVAGEVRAGVPAPVAKPAEPPRAAAGTASDPVFERLIALHRSATLLSAAPPLPAPAGQCCVLAPAN